MSDQPQTPRTLRSPDWAQARQAAFDAPAALPPHWLPLGETVGETLAEDLRAERPVPHYTSSAMDGWAVNGPGPWRINRGEYEQIDQRVAWARTEEPQLKPPRSLAVGEAAPLGPASNRAKSEAVKLLRTPETRAALDAACKYPWTREDAPLRPDGTRSRKFGVYEDDLPVFRWFREGVSGSRKSMEAQVMDLADDISYSVHDVEDGVVNAAFQLKWLAIPEHRERVVETTRQWYLPLTDPAEVDEALARLEATDVWVSEMDGSRRALAAMKDMTSQLIGRFCTAAFDATRQVFGNEPLTRHGADVVVPAETETEIAVMKGIAAAYVMASEQRQPLYARQRELLAELVELLDASGDRYLEPMFAFDWREAADEAERGERDELVLANVHCESFRGLRPGFTPADVCQRRT